MIACKKQNLFQLKSFWGKLVKESTWTVQAPGFALLMCKGISDAIRDTSSIEFVSCREIFTSPNTDQEQPPLKMTESRYLWMQ